LLGWLVKRRKNKVLSLASAQIGKAIDIVSELEKAVTASAEGRKDEAEKSIERLFLVEEEIDNLRRAVFEELARGQIEPGAREDIMHLVKRLDVMADCVKDSARDVKILMNSDMPSEIRETCVNIARGLVDCSINLRGSIERLGDNPEIAREFSRKVDLAEHRIDEEYVKARSLFIRYSTKLDPATLLILKDLVDAMEQVADISTDTADYVRILAASEEKAS